jgi:hypothetical protein
MNNIKNIIADFSNKQNLLLLWEVLLDELDIKGNTNNKTIISNIQAVFHSNIAPFINKISPVAGLMETNKLFLKQVLIAVNRLFPNLKQDQQIKRINIGEEEVKEVNQLYKVEDIHSARQSNFEKQVQQKREEFDSLAAFKKPKELNFSEKYDDGKITEMQSLIAETISRRNFEIEQYQTNLNTNANLDSAENWLQPAKTSVKSEKQNVNGLDTIDIQRKLKYINNDSQTLNQNTKKVSWNDDATIENTVNNISLVIEDSDSSGFNTNIFNKLKKINTVNPTVVSTIDSTIDSTIGSTVETMKVEVNKLSQQMELLNAKFDILLNKFSQFKIFEDNLN